MTCTFVMAYRIGDDKEYCMAYRNITDINTAIKRFHEDMPHCKGKEWLLSTKVCKGVV